MIDVLPGFREFYPEDCYARNYLFEKIRNACKNFCFSEYDGPILEPLELYTEKSGEEIVNQLFNFTDRGGRLVAMRPEMTPSAARMIGSKINTLKRPLKWFSIEENFRYERPQKGRLRSFYQFNVDIFDEPSLYAEAEIISLTIAILKSFGLTSDHIVVRLSDRILWTFFLQIFDVNFDKIPEILSIIDKAEKEPQDIILEKLKNSEINDPSALDKILQFKSIKNLNELQSFIDNLQIQSPINQEINNRILQFKDLINRLNRFGLSDFITIDFTIVRGLAYYTGFIFEIFERSEKSRAIAGGGRYDNLIEKFGYPKTSAVGLAIGDVVLQDILIDKNLLPIYNPTCDLFIIFDEISENIAMKDIFLLRTKGIVVNYVMKNLTIDKQFKHAIKSTWVAKYTNGSEEILLRNIQKKEEFTINHNDICKIIHHD